VASSALGAAARVSVEAVGFMRASGRKWILLVPLVSAYR
jgi:hypothetical protein